MFSCCCKNEFQVISSPVLHPIQDPMQDYALDLVIHKSAVSSSACFCLWEQCPFSSVQAVFLWNPLSVDSEYTFLAGTLEMMLYHCYWVRAEGTLLSLFHYWWRELSHQAKVGCVRFSTVKWLFSLYLFTLKKYFIFGWVGSVLLCIGFL